jgi:hypothetical protein
MKTFSRNFEDFVCANCGQKNHGNGYTNHCPNCLYSKHVDQNPGDRSNICLGLMKPIAYDPKQGILHHCENCRFEKYNKLQVEDNFEIILELSTMPS